VLDRSNPARPRAGRRPRESTITVRAEASPRAPTLPFSVFAQLFGAIASHFLVSLSHLVIVNSAIFGVVNSIIFIYNELSHFSYRAQSFYDFISHSSTVNSAILLENSAIFYYGDLSHFAIVKSDIPCPTLLSHSSLLYCSLLSHFSLLQCSTIFYYYSAHQFLMQKELSHSSLLQYLANFHHKKVLSHSLMLQYLVVFCYYSAQTFLITTTCEAAQSFCKMTELGHGRKRAGAGSISWLGHGRAWGRLAARLWSCRTEPRARGRRTESIMRGAWFDHAGSVELRLAGLGDE
jgi:hypothetical protein